MAITRAEDVLGVIGDEDIAPQNVITEKACFYTPQIFGGKHYEAGVDHIIEIPYIPGDPVSMESVRAQIAAIRKACKRPSQSFSDETATVELTLEEELTRWTVAQLMEEADALEIKVTRGDGTEGGPLKADYIAAIVAANQDAETEDPNNTNEDKEGA